MCVRESNGYFGKVLLVCERKSFPDSFSASSSALLSSEEAFNLKQTKERVRGWVISNLESSSTSASNNFARSIC